MGGDYVAACIYQFPLSYLTRISMRCPTKRTTALSTVIIPNTFEEAMQSPQAQQWKEACNAEYQCLIDNTTWKLMPLPRGASLVKGKWVFDIKKDVDNNPVRFKARWVARGFTQKQGVDYDDTYASVTKPSTVRVLLSIFAAYGMECKPSQSIRSMWNSHMGMSSSSTVKEPYVSC